MRFIVNAPDFSNKSAGNVMLYTLNEELNRLGYKSEILKFLEKRTITDDTIVIYPEVIDGNPLNAKNIVRYYLNREGMAAGNAVNSGPNDFILAFNKLYHPSPDAILRYEKIDPNFYSTEISPLNRRLDCTYIGKGLHYSEYCKVIDGTIEITRTAPAMKEGLANLLRQTRFYLPMITVPCLTRRRFYAVQ